MEPSALPTPTLPDTGVANMKGAYTHMYVTGRGLAVGRARQELDIERVRWALGADSFATGDGCGASRSRCARG